MTISTYLRDKISVILLNTAGNFFLFLYLLATGSTVTTTGLISLIWLLTSLIVLSIDYIMRKNHFQKIESLMDRLDQPYLIQELMDTPLRLEDQLYRNILYRSNKAVIEQIRKLRSEQQEYREYLEGWIHEARRPITGLRLAIHNQSDPQRMELYLTEMDHLIEQALFYAKSEQVYKDFQVMETDLRDILIQVIRQNKYLLLQSEMNLHIQFDHCSVRSDPKWIAFIFIQLILNAIKYKNAGRREMIFRISEAETGTTMTIEDNGIGIPPEEISRVFEKGFTGSNGRSHEKSTGIGLYLCHKLCGKLNLSIHIESVIHQYTRVHLFFPNNDYLIK